LVYEFNENVGYIERFKTIVIFLSCLRVAKFCFDIG